jgi:hypothetical protein
VKHFASRDFWQCYHRLPRSIQRLADRCFRLLKRDAGHPSLRLKKVGRYWSVRVGMNWRALAVEQDEGLVWFWIGSHAEYDHIVSR